MSRTLELPGGVLFDVPDVPLRVVVRVMVRAGALPRRPKRGRYSRKHEGVQTRLAAIYGVTRQAVNHAAKMERAELEQPKTPGEPAFLAKEGTTPRALAGAGAEPSAPV